MVTDFQHNLQEYPNFQSMVIIAETQKAYITQERAMIIIILTLMGFLGFGLYFWIRSNRKAIAALRSDLASAKR